MFSAKRKANKSRGKKEYTKETPRERSDQLNDNDIQSDEEWLTQDAGDLIGQVSC